MCFSKSTIGSPLKFLTIDIADEGTQNETGWVSNYTVFLKGSTHLQVFYQNRETTLYIAWYTRSNDFENTVQYNWLTTLCALLLLYCVIYNSSVYLICTSCLTLHCMGENVLSITGTHSEEDENNLISWPFYLIGDTQKETSVFKRQITLLIFL